MDKFNKKRTKYIKTINQLLAIFFHTKKVDYPLDVGNIDKVLIIDFTGIGDCIMLIPTLSILKEYDVSIDIVGGSYMKSLLHDQSLVNNFFVFDGLHKLNHIKDWMHNLRDISTIIKKIKKSKYDLIIEPRGDLRHIFFMHFLYADIKASINYTGGDSLLNCCVPYDEEIRHLVDDKLYLINELGFKAKKDYRMPKLYEKKEKGKIINELGIQETKKIIGIHPGASNLKRMWNKYPELILKLNREFENLVFLIFMGPNEPENICGFLSDNLDVGLNYIISKTGIGEYRERISICDVLICNDSGCAHIGGALGIDTYVLFAPSNPEACRPLNENVYVIEQGSYHPNRSMEELPLDFVFSKIVESW